MTTLTNTHQNRLMDGTISTHAMRKSSRVLKEIVAIYFPVLSIPNEKYFDMYGDLLWVESYVYLIDKIVEDAQQHNDGVWSIDEEMTTLTETIAALGLLTPAVEDHLSRIVQYAKLETIIVCKKEVLTLESIRKSWRQRSCDLRLLGTLIAEMAGISTEYESNSYLQTCLNCIWMIGELVYDHADYAEDDMTGSFNVLRLFERFYGRNIAGLYLSKEIAKIRAQFDRAVINLPTARRPVLQQTADIWWQKLRMPDRLVG